jgi:cleavage and polyadenylation specificity factor subunit 1
VFTKLDLVKAFHNIPVAEEDVGKTAVITRFGLYEFVRTPFGLCNAAQSFQRFMDAILGDLEHVHIYIDDVLIATHDVKTNLQVLHRVCKRLAELAWP